MNKRLLERLLVETLLAEAQSPSLAGSRIVSILDCKEIIELMKNRPSLFFLPSETIMKKQFRIGQQEKFGDNEFSNYNAWKMVINSLYPELSFTESTINRKNNLLHWITPSLIGEESWFEINLAKKSGGLKGNTRTIAGALSDLQQHMGKIRNP